MSIRIDWRLKIFTLTANGRRRSFLLAAGGKVYADRWRLLKLFVRSLMLNAYRLTWRAFGVWEISKPQTVYLLPARTGMALEASVT